MEIRTAVRFTLQWRIGEEQKMEKNIKITKAAIVILFAVCVLMDICGPKIVAYVLQRESPLLTGDVRTVLCLAGGYILSVCAFLCLYHLYRLVERIGEGAVFTETNVRELNRIDMDVTAAAVITLIIGVTCVLMLIAVTAMAVLMALIIRVVRDAFSRAAAMKDELDYTI